MLRNLCRVFCVALPAMLGGCVTAGVPTPGSTMGPIPLAGSVPSERYAMPALPRPKAKPPEGTIYNGGRTGLDLYADNRAGAVGDILMVQVVENAKGKKEATTETERQSSVSGGIAALFGIEKWLSGKNPNFTPSRTSMDASLTNDFSGEGETERKDTLTATLSARVIDVTMDGNLVIRGYREVRVNNETQHIILSGIVRPGDISPDNMILSSYIADARIEYSGTGALSDKQQPGWLARSLDVIWPF